MSARTRIPTSPAVRALPWWALLPSVAAFTGLLALLALGGGAGEAAGGEWAATRAVGVLVGDLVEQLRQTFAG
ncbi:hypothetical protein [Streptomyces alkaliterrae]|uniref:Uncharacterized protein n=1 Tax=Streptomyces alkaliterrae TaxID=2213162 RepID=A0A5P0YKK0_9ACTN|nr:hypothetical protein [Streptomyces alkaliterrae]MBB1252076.1 hypothetical protein [Streptomyces alkaliterrae]MBB1260811.1 hypothetical protein [Streptomyces alkaliterrae]MQS00440.1 hypothetical protein [Streptomyces alkaliterrae]